MSAPSVTVLPVRGSSPYEVVIGHGVSARVLDLLGEAPTRVALVVADELRELATALHEALAARYDVTVVPVPAGEHAKTAATAVACWEALGEAGFTRSDAVVTFGGGATTDLGGFVAATWLRGVRVVHVPTTLLAMVDAAVGGKTGINSGAGKNLVGSFHEPAGVLCDLALLASLPRAELVAGLGEVVKCGFIADPVILDLVERTPSVDDVIDPAGPVLRELVERAIAVKIDVVVADLKETGGAGGHPGREVLNYGHTLAHAIERAEAYGIRHGEAVAIGCVFVAEVAHRVGLIPAEVVARHRSAFGRVGLPIGYDRAPFADLLATMRVDKKARGAQLRLIVLAGDPSAPDGALAPRVLAGPDESVLADAYAALVPAPAPAAGAAS